MKVETWGGFEVLTVGLLVLCAGYFMFFYNWENQKIILTRAMPCIEVEMMNGTHKICDVQLANQGK